MPSKRAKSTSPNAVGALTRLKAMQEQIKQTPLEKFVFDSFDEIVALHPKGYTIPDICQALKEEGYAASPPSVHAALNKAASMLDKQNPYKRSEQSLDVTASEKQSVPQQGQEVTQNTSKGNDNSHLFNDF